MSTDEVIYLFEDGFETQRNNLRELFPNDGSRWTNTHQVNPGSGENEIAIESNIVLEGNNSLIIYAKASGAILKIDK